MKRELGGRRREAEAACARWVARLLGLRGGSAGSRALTALAPLPCMIPDLPQWGARERALLAAMLRGKDAASEAPVAFLYKHHRRLEAALRTIAGRGADLARDGAPL